jgi:hypothetical protein
VVDNHMHAWHGMAWREGTLQVRDIALFVFGDTRETETPERQMEAFLVCCLCPFALPCLALPWQPPCLVVCACCEFVVVARIMRYICIYMNVYAVCVVRADGYYWMDRGWMDR